MIWNIYFVYL